MKTIGWGKPGIYYRKTTDQYFQKTVNPVENSTALETTKGDKLEAKGEGGEVDAVRHKKSSYVLRYGIRVAAEVEQHIAHEDGVVIPEYVVVVVPENAAAPGIFIEHSEVTVDDSFAADEGGVVTYEHAVLTAASGKSVKHGIMTVTALTGDNAGKFSISANGKDYQSSTNLDGSAPANSGGGGGGGGQ